VRLGERATQGAPPAGVTQVASENHQRLDVSLAGEIGYRVRHREPSSRLASPAAV
jgi:hypothetical protein